MSSSNDATATVAIEAATMLQRALHRPKLFSTSLCKLKSHASKPALSNARQHGKRPRASLTPVSTGILIQYCPRAD